MLNPQNIGYVVFGIIACFSGYSLFRSLLPLWGFIVVGWLAMIIAPVFIQVPPAQDLFLRVGAFVAGGLVGAAIAFPLYYLIVFISGAALGALAGMIIGAFFETGGINSFANLSTLSAMSFPPQPHTPIQFFIMVILGLILGLVALSFQRFMVSASSAFIGSAALVGAFSGVIVKGLITSNPGIIIVLVWFLVGFIGLVIQYNTTGEDE